MQENLLWRISLTSLRTKLDNILCAVVISAWPTVIPTYSLKTVHIISPGWTSEENLLPPYLLQWSFKDHISPLTHFPIHPRPRSGWRSSWEISQWAAGQAPFQQKWSDLTFLVTFHWTCTILVDLSTELSIVLTKDLLCEAHRIYEAKSLLEIAYFLQMTARCTVEKSWQSLESCRTLRLTALTCWINSVLLYVNVMAILSYMHQCT